MKRYGAYIKWGNQTFEVDGYENTKAAIDAVVDWAEKAGWKNPKWWQFWRWKDSKFTKEQLKVKK